ncbi:hypothetical protein SCLCIDRAFT_1217192, partial [Scleroderma citrinum Foug A]
QKAGRRDLEEFGFDGGHAREIEQKKNSGQTCAERRRGCAALRRNGAWFVEGDDPPHSMAPCIFHPQEAWPLVKAQGLDSSGPTSELSTQPSFQIRP